MAIKAFVTDFQPGIGTNNAISFDVAFIDTNTGLILENYTGNLVIGTDLVDYTPVEIRNAIVTQTMAEATNQSYSMTTADITSGAFQGKVFNFSPGRSIVTGTGATGWQISPTRDSFVTYTPKITTTSSIGSSQEGYVVLEIAPTNSATAGDWVEVARLTNGQTVTLALALQSVQPISAPLSAYVPAAYYVKVRSVNVTGTPSYSMISGQEVLA